ncbi:hypothetical protein NVIE_002450 [Nitrososphaera viennensis EN76]|uniref:Uncharacterized protein n=1 Tax=Nitrososphaera viennensis EN76 TaxID=926571 RepID=A0A060HLJ4_9ARCH|nr:hypothetical protein NVIE_002450 [Nitrososphaera viennensis EN76]
MHKLCTRIKYFLLFDGKCLEPKEREAEIISEILLKAASEPEFRNSLIRDPAAVLEMYNVSPQAKMVIKRTIIDLTQ